MAAALLAALMIFNDPLHAGSTEASKRNFIAYSWSQPDQEYSNIIPFHWLKSSDAVTMEALVSKAVTATQAMPRGHRVLFSWDIHRAMSSHNNGDFLYTENGAVSGCNGEQGFRPYRSLWWDNGVQRVRHTFEEFFRLYRQAGGELDVFVLDFEQGFSYWHLVDLVEKNYSCGLDHYLDAIQADTRFSSIGQAVSIEDLKSLKRWYENDDHLRWSAYTWMHLARYIDAAIYQPLANYYPDAEFSNYGYYYQLSEFGIPDIHGADTHKYTNGVHVGSHQSREIYGWMNLPAGTRLAGAEYPVTPFNAFRFALNKLRAMLLSSPLPVSPWFAYKSFTNSHLKDNDFYQELILHSLLSGIDYLLYWNPSGQTDFSKSDDRLLSQLLSRVELLVKDGKLRYLTEELVNWLDDLVITKVVRSDGRQLWRVSADIGIDEHIRDKIIQSNPAKIRINGIVYDFHAMKVWGQGESLSDKGLWLISN